MGDKTKLRQIELYKQYEKDKTIVDNLNYEELKLLLEYIENINNKLRKLVEYEN